jgi:predicted nuclease of restriction endonuclease-like (RecB) superfamily
MDNTIIAHFQQIKQLIAHGRGKALQAANTYSLLTYWNIGAYLNEQLSEKTFGKKVVVQLADWLLQQEPTLKGYDRRNLYRMRNFYDTWDKMDWSLLPAQFQKKQINVGNSEENSEQKFVVLATPQLKPLPNVLTRITWSHHIEILRGATSSEEMLFYLILSIKDRYNVLELRRQIESALFERQMLAKHTLIIPEHPKKEDLANIFRDKYLFEFIDLKEPYSEFDLQKALIKRMKEFLLELGRDFSFIDEEFPVKVGMHDYFIDLVFYHRELQCLVAFDLKVEEFKPEHLGKMNFYLEVLDRDVKKAHENPSIGVVLCKSKNDEVVEIAMSRQLSPTLVAAYETKFIDKSLLQRMLHLWTEDWENNQAQKD